MNQLDNYELSTLHYTVSYYIDNANLDEDENEWLNLLKNKIDSIMQMQAQYDMETVQLLSHTIQHSGQVSTIIILYTGETPYVKRNAIPM